MKIPVEILVLLCLLVGMLPAFTVGPLLAAAVSGTLNGNVPEYSLSILALVFQFLPFWR